MLPVVATILGVLDGETFPIINYLWISFIFLGIWLMHRK
jgi:hypothetical protein